MFGFFVAMLFPFSVALRTINDLLGYALRHQSLLAEVATDVNLSGELTAAER